MVKILHDLSMMIDTLGPIYKSILGIFIGLGLFWIGYADISKDKKELLQNLSDEQRSRINTSIEFMKITRNAGIGGVVVACSYLIYELFKVLAR